MKTSKRLLSFILAVVMVITSCSIGLTAFAQDPDAESVFTYIDDEGKAVEITYESLENLVSTYAPTIIKALGDKLGDIGVNVDEVVNAEDPIYELVAQLSPKLMELIGGSGSPKDVLGNSYKPTDQYKYSYLNDENAAMSFWSLYKFCADNENNSKQLIRDFARKTLAELKPLLNAYSEQENAYKSSLDAAITEIKALLGTAYDAENNHVLFNVPLEDPEEQAMFDQLSASFTEAFGGLNPFIATLESINDIVCSNGAKLSEIPTTVNDVDLSVFIQTTEVYARAANAIGEKETLTLPEAVYYYFNTQVTDLAIRVALATSQGNPVTLETEFGDLAVKPGEYYLDCVRRDCWTYEIFAAFLKGNLGLEMDPDPANWSLYWFGFYEIMALDVVHFNSISQDINSTTKDFYFDSLTTVLVQTGIYESAEAVKAARDAVEFTDSDFVTLKNRFIAIGKAYDPRNPESAAINTTYNEFKSGKNGRYESDNVGKLVRENINDVFKFYFLYRMNSSWYETFKTELLQWNEGDAWTNTMKNIASGAEACFSAYTAGCVLNGYDIESTLISYMFIAPYLDAIIAQNMIIPSITATYEWDNYKPENKIAIDIVNTLINNYINEFLDPDTTIGNIVAGALDSLLFSKVDLYNSLKNIYIRIAENPVQTIFELLPILVIMIDEVIVPMAFNAPANDVLPADVYYNGLNAAIGPDGFLPILGKYGQAEGSPVGLAGIGWDLNKVLPDALHWLIGDNSYTYTYYNATENFGVDENGNPTDEVVSVVYGEKETGALGTKYNADGEKTDLVPCILDIYKVDKMLAGASIADLEGGVGEIVSELASFFTEVVDEYVAEHGNDVKQYVVDEGMGKRTPVNRGLNNILVAIPKIIDGAGKKFVEKYNIDSDWSFGTFEQDAYGCTYNTALADFKALPAKNASSADILGNFVDIFINHWFNALTDILNDTVSDTDNDITGNIPIITAVLNSVDLFGEKSALTDILNGFFGLSRAEKLSFTFEAQENGYVGLSTLNAYFLLSNLEPLITFVMGLVNSDKNDAKEISLSETASPVMSYKSDIVLGITEDISITISKDDISKITTKENVAAANELIATLDEILSTLLNSIYVDGYRIDHTDSLISAVVTFLTNHLGKATTDDLIGLLKDYLRVINAASTKDEGSWNVNSGKDGCAVDAKKVYSKENLSILVTRTYALIEQIVESVFPEISGDETHRVLSAIEGIISPSAVAIRSDVINEKIMKYYDWNEVAESNYAKKLGYDNLKAGDKETFYADLVDSLGAITSIVGALFCATGYYNNVLEPIIASICDGMGVTTYVKEIAADATGEEALLAVIKAVSGIVQKLLDAPASAIIGFIKGLVGILDDTTLHSILDGALNPIYNEINGLGAIVANLSVTFSQKIAGDENGEGGLVNTIKDKIGEFIPENNIAVSLVNKFAKTNISPIDWKYLAKASNGEYILLVYTIAVSTILDSNVLQLILGQDKVELVKTLSSLDASEVLNIIKMIVDSISTVQGPTEAYWTFRQYVSEEAGSFVYPKGVTAAEAEDAVDQLDNLVKNVFPLLKSLDVLKQDNLSDLVSGLLYKNELITKIAKAVYGGIESKAKGVFTFSPSQFADYLMDSSYGNTYSDAANALRKCAKWSDVKDVNWGFTDGSAKAQQGFINGLAALCRPINDVLAVFLAEGKGGDLIQIVEGVLSDINVNTTLTDKDAAVRVRLVIENGNVRIFTLNTAAPGAKENHIKIELNTIISAFENMIALGTNGYESAIIPFLEAFMVDDVKTYSEYIKDYNKAKDNLLINILNPVFSFVNDVLEAPFDTITKVLPNVANFIDNGGITQLINNLLAPVTQGIIGTLNDNGINVDYIIEQVAGKDLGGIIADAAKGKVNLDGLKLEIGNLNECNIQHLIVPLLQSILSSKLGIELPDFTWAAIAGHGTEKTVSSAARNAEGKFTTIQIEARQGEVLVAVLRYIEKALVTNAAAINKLICSIEKVAKNKTIVSILDSVFAQIGTAKNDDIVLAVFYLLTEEPQNRFFDYTGFKYKDYDFAYPSTVDTDFLTIIGPMLDGLIGGLVEGGLGSLVTSNVYKDSIISSLACGLYGAIEGVKINNSLTLTQLLAQTDIDFSTANVASLLTNKDYGQQYSSAAKAIAKAGSWKNVNKDALSWGVTDRDSFVHALCAVLRPIYGVLDVLLNDGSLGLFDLIYLPGSDGYTSAIVPLMEAFGLYNIKTQYQYRQDMSKEYDAILLDILNPLLDKVEDLLNAPIEMLADILPNLALFFANDGLLQLIENLLGPINALLDALKPVVDINDLLKAIGLDIPKELSKLGLVGSGYKFDIYNLTASLKPLIGAENIVGLLNKVLGLIKIKGQPLGIELAPIDWLRLASHGEVITTEASQAATYGGRIYVKADQAEVLIAVLSYLIETINYRDNYNTISNLVGGLLGGASETVSDVIDQVLGMLAGDTDQVIADLCGLLQTLA